MHKLYASFLLIIIFCSCKNGGANLNGEEEISAEDFIRAFPATDFPLVVTDTALKNFGDSTIISKTVFTQFIADTALQNFVSNPAKTTIHPAGILRKKERDFLLATFDSAKQTKLGVFVLDDKHKFLAAFPLLHSNSNDAYRHSVSITEEPTFILKREKIVNNQSLYSRSGFAFSAAANNFSFVLRDSNEDTLKAKDIINPIDTFPTANKFSGNYLADKKNYIAVRDGKNATNYIFFIHFEKDNGACTGELKGTMNMLDDKSAVYTESGDPCVINFKFTSSSIIIKEENNCGNHRGITCPFDFTFKKKKPEKLKSK